MENFDWQAAFASDADRFIDRLHFAGAFTAHMGPVDATILAGNLRQSDQLLCLRVVSGGINQRSGNAESTLLHRGGNHGLHLRKLRRSGGSIVISNYGFTYLRRANVGA